MDNNVAAPDKGEAAPLTNVESQASAAPASTPEASAPEAPAPIFTNEEAQAIKTFLDNNGGLEGVKKTISARQAQNPPQPQGQPDPNPMNAGLNMTTPAAQLQDHTAGPKFKGGATLQELAFKQYFQGLGDREEYASIREEIRSGEALKVLKEYNVPVIDGNDVNTEDVEKFLSLYAKTKPAPTPEVPVTSTPTADFVQVADGKITSMEQAMLVLSQDREARAAGREGHPLAQQANEFFDGVLNAQQNRGRREHKVLESK